MSERSDKVTSIQAETIAVLGCGTMGAGIAQVRQLIEQCGTKIAPENEADILHVLCETTHKLEV